MHWSVLVVRKSPFKRDAGDRMGFTLIEVMTMVAILGITATIAAPSYLGWANQQRLKAAQEQVHMVLHRARHQAMKKMLPQQVSFREQKDGVEWSIHPVDAQPIAWTKLPPQVKLDSETTLRRKKDIYIMQFNEHGEVNGQLGRVTLTLPNSPQNKRCVVISTLLGALRSGETHAKPKDGKYCY
jgi:Tfp pilus assembly protein FimT